MILYVYKEFNSDNHATVSLQFHSVLLQKGSLGVTAEELGALQSQRKFIIIAW